MAGQGQAIVSTDFGVEVRLASLTGSERLGETFSYDLEVLTKDPVKFVDHLGTGVGVEILEAAGPWRVIRGVLFETETLGFDAQFGYRARLTVKPWTELLNLGLNTRIFQKMTTIDIVKAVFKDAGFTGYDVKATGSYQPREYCVQWRESDLHFIQRLMEEEGLYTFIQHTEATHKLLICDTPTNHVTPEGRGEVLLNTDAGEGLSVQRLWSWTETLRPGLAKVSLRDQHFKKPQAALTAEKDVPKEGPQDVAEFYDYPGYFGYLSDGGDQAGTIRAKARLEASRAQRKVYRGIGDVVALAAGDKISIAGQGKGAFSGEVMLVAVHHRLENVGYGHEESKGKAKWSVEIEAIPADTPWHVDQRKVKPTAGGPQTAVVVGPDGQVVHVDEHGRVLVQFFWDRRSKTEKGEAITCDTRSCWVRVSQAWADAGFGHMVLPRIGEEVIVDFLDGDPDRPIITGRVHNATHKTPYTLPDEKTKSTWKSQSVGDAPPVYDPSAETEEPPTGTGFNEFGYEDKSGSEEVYFHAQRDYVGRTRHDHSHKIGHDEIRRVGHNSELTIKKNLTTKLDEGDEERTLTKGSRKTTINKSETVEIETGDHKTTVDQGNLSISVSMGKISIEAMQEILLKVGQNTIKISQQGIEQHGLTVDVKADTAFTTNGQLTAEHKAGIGMTISGAIVNIN